MLTLFDLLFLQLFPVLFAVNLNVELSQSMTHNGSGVCEVMDE